MTVDLLNFDDAIAESARFKKRHLLLGNGFSIACRWDIFTYGSLLDQADFKAAPHLRDVFDTLGTQDFEAVIKTLQDGGKILPIYGAAHAPAAKKMAADAALLKEILIETVAANHPDIPNTIEDERFHACRQFLSHFLGSDQDGKVYTLNYDLLLYWALMHDEDSEMGFDPISLNKNDGFGRDEDTEPEYVNWMGESSAHGQRVHYLHGALHLFDAGAELQKYTWINTGERLLDQARDAMGQDKFPLFVAEGESAQKLSKIKHNAYLHHSYKSFHSQMDQRGQCLFIFGHSLAENDRHILKKIARGKVEAIYVGLHEDPGTDPNKAIIAAAEGLAEERGKQFPLEVKFFDTASAAVWG